MSGKIKVKSPWSFLQMDSNGMNNNTSKKSISPNKLLNKINQKNSNQNTDNNSTKLKMLKSKSSTTLTTKTTIVTRTAEKSNSISDVLQRPNTLDVYNRDGQNAEAKAFIGEALSAWRAKARCNIVPAERLQELFHELQFNPSEKQISEMLQTAKAFARKGSRQLNGLTFGEFCVLAADLKRFRTCNFSTSPDPIKTLSSLQNNDNTNLEPNTQAILNEREEESCSPVEGHSMKNNEQKSLTKNPSNYIKESSISSNSKINHSRKISETHPPEVFLGGSCNPTTWRADVAIPTLQNLGISFYNPQVSDWTPDLIELEYRAKEKARVLFFVMDSETRASAGAIEVAYIAGQNARQLVLVLHSYRPDQRIFNEPISEQEYIDLSRNQQLLRELVTRRGLPVLDNIPQGLQRTKQILAGIRDPPTNIASILIVVRGAFDRVVDASSLDGDEISLKQCQRALSFLGYAQSLLSLENLKSIVQSQKETLDPITITTTATATTTTKVKKEKSINKQLKAQEKSENNDYTNIKITFDDFCILAAYLSVLQQEIHESGCISPIKGTNLPPPPIFLANMQGLHENGLQVSSSFTKYIFRNSSSTSVSDGQKLSTNNSSSEIFQSRDSGTSSPQPTLQENLLTGKTTKYLQKRSKISFNVEVTNSAANPGTGEESDSNDSVFSSSGSSINSIADNTPFCISNAAEFRDVYLGGSCFLRTKWRQQYAIPYFNENCITFHLPALHESLLPSQLNLSGDVVESTIEEKKKSNAAAAKLRRRERKNTHELLSSSSSEGIGSSIDDLELEDERTWPLAIRPNIFNPSLLDSSRVLLFVITNETRSLAPMTLAAHCIGLMYNVVLCVQMLPDDCVIENEKLTPAAIKDYNRGRSYLIDLAKRQGVPVFNDLRSALKCTVDRVKGCNSRI